MGFCCGFSVKRYVELINLYDYYEIRFEIGCSVSVECYQNKQVILKD